MFLDAIDASELLGQHISGSYIYGHIKNAIDYVGVENAVQLKEHGENGDGKIYSYSMDSMCCT